MSPQRHHQGPSALDLQDNRVYRARDGAMRCYAKTPEFFRSADQNPELMDGRRLALCHVNGPHDVHYPVREMHPEGDELLILASGSLSVAFRSGGIERMERLPPHAAFIVPAGMWHRLIVHGLAC
jgi:hypothetical protein